MAIELNKPSAFQVKNQTKAGRFSDGGGLWLQVTKSGAKSWLFRYQTNGKARAMGLGPVHTVPLALAREKAANARRSLVDGIDPLGAKHRLAADRKMEAARAVTFEKCAFDYIAAHERSWKS